MKSIYPLIQSKSAAYALILALATGLCACGDSDKAKPIVESPPKISYEMFDDKVVHDIRIRFEDGEFWEQLVQHKETRDELEKTTYLLGSVTVDGEALDSIGVRIKGESSYQFYPGKKKSLKIAFNRFKKDQRYQGLKKISLNNCFKDPSFMREKLYLDLLLASGAPAQRSAFAKVFINDMYWGVYLIVEQIDKDFFEQNFSDRDGVLHQGEPRAYLVWRGNELANYIGHYSLESDKTDDDWSRLINLIDVINNYDADARAQSDSLDAILDVDGMLKSWALNNIIMNVDAFNMHYPHNYFLYQHSITKRIHWINYDGNYSFGAWSPIFTLDQMIQLPLTYIPNSTKQSGTIKKLLVDNIHFRNRYLDLAKESSFKHFNPQKLGKRIDELKQLIEQAVKEDSLNMYGYQDFLKNINEHIGDINDPGAFIPGLKPFIAARHKFVDSVIQRHIAESDLAANN